MTIISGEKITKRFPIESKEFFKKKEFTALDEVSISIGKAGTIGVVGESGSGKSTLGEILGDLQKPTEGIVYYKGKDIRSFSKEEYGAYRKNVQFIFQNPQGSMNPYFKIEKVLIEPMKTLIKDIGEKEALEKIEEMIHQVGLDKTYLQKYPSELSGGQSQRIAIARALLLEPELVICDECVSALDVSVQAQILNLMKELQKRLGISYLFISHDIATVKYMSDDLLVLYKGNVVEKGPAEDILRDPEHEYTNKLLKYARLQGA